MGELCVLRRPSVIYLDIEAQSGAAISALVVRRKFQSGFRKGDENEIRTPWVLGFIHCSARMGWWVLLFAQDGKLNIHVTPKQAYVFLDGRAISEASKHHSFSLTAGDHKIQLANYGYELESRTVTITAGKTSDLDVTLKAVGATVSGPFGAMTIGGPPRDAVLLNGKTPAYFVGHVDEFNNNFLWWKQELVVPPGTYQVTILGGDKEVWSGSVNVPANQRVVVDIPKGVSKTVPWPRGETQRDTTLHSRYGQCDRRCCQAYCGVVSNHSANQLRGWLATEVDLLRRTSC